MRALVVINPVSGPARARRADAGALARQVLERRGLEVEVALTTGRGHARRMSEHARTSGIGLVVAWGGDGTINEVASALTLTDIPLGIVPGGSGNGLARDLGLPLDPECALEVVATGHARRIDAGRLDDALFFNVAGIGLDAEIARRLASPQARRGLPGYVQATFAELPGYRARTYAIEAAGSRTEQRALFIAVANSRQYGNGAQIAPAARLDDGKLDLVVVQAQPAWRLLAQLPAFFRGTLAPRPGLHMAQVADGLIHADGPIGFHVDGEPRAVEGTLRIGVLPSALRVVVP
ncbi:MAG: diacylglycerol kinase family lipid kinase [Acidobacteria bacterium]|nr:diacylglycerol kinase family lipid kinase [Acidobacteriota bacterium]